MYLLQFDSTLSQYERLNLSLLKVTNSKQMAEVNLIIERFGSFVLVSDRNCITACLIQSTHYTMFEPSFLTTRTSFINHNYLCKNIEESETFRSNTTSKMTNGYNLPMSYSCNRFLGDRASRTYQGLSEERLVKLSESTERNRYIINFYRTNW